ncbi:HNH endonuclease [Brasilonema octagenarum UFV-E1]|uniref:HNH endonuclease n=1 Tax=Brasilonema sennae CENA114 TaxID=415709 RepID=A0A856MAJ0_9CYAN|nr:HNH endonuclease [Brasilonema sennae]QDL07059.1 HNH endonuclease [Brasilonema sennae CENA114]QDL13422.1 HNH endonuclease [Brasilonema octagenarum UFV-E1]
MNSYYTVVAERANHRCEYCHAPELIFNFPFEVEHIIPLSRQGADDESNLALACRSCNLRKGTPISGIQPNSNTQARFFHPRQNRWDEHFQAIVEFGTVMGITSIGIVTVEYLQINSSSQVAARQLWIRLGLFP